MNLKKYRHGQDAAHDVIVTRVRNVRAVSDMTSDERVASAADRYTAIVLPTRYGKSDVIRCTAIDLWRSKHISAALALSPNCLLRDQLVDQTKVNDMMRRYLIEAAGSLSYRALKGTPADVIAPTANNEFMVSATIQLISEDPRSWEQWVEHMLYHHRAPVLVYIDEAHTGSERNTWGAVVERLVKHGACACLLTATPMRADGAKIPGFEFEVAEQTPVKRYRTRDGERPETITVDVYEGVSQVIKLKAHHTTTFRDAWGERPSPLCRISRLPFDVNLREVLDSDSPNVTLSSLKPSVARAQLGRITRAAPVVRAGVGYLVQELAALRGLQADAAGIVFVGNDEDHMKRVNEHAHAVREQIEAIDSSLEVVIATSSDGNEGTDKIKKFAKGRGDVLIVKQMAGIGLDVARLKVALDLSPIRTPAAYIQRVMRIATPCPPSEVCVLIVPDDCINKALFETLVSDEGGEASCDDVTLIESYQKERSDSDPRPLFMVDSITESDFDDSQGVKAAAELRPDVNQILTAIPELLGVMTHAQVAQRLAKSGLVFGPRMEVPINTGVEIESLRGTVLELGKEITNRKIKNQPYTSGLYGEVSRTVWTTAKARAKVVPVGVELEDIVDIEMLKRLESEFGRMLRDTVGQAV